MPMLQQPRLTEKDEDGLPGDTEALIPQASDAGSLPENCVAGRGRRRLAAAVVLAAAAAALLFAGRGLRRQRLDSGSLVGLQAVVPGVAAPAVAPAVAPVAAVASETDDPNWGCGLVGLLPGISQAGVVSPETQRLVDGIKSSSTFNKASFWNWNLAPQTVEQGTEHLSKDFIFMPEQWGAGIVDPKLVRQAGAVNFLDSNGKPCPAEMANIFLGSNEPDIKGSCMGNMFGKCSAPCDDASVAAGDCPAAHLDVHLPPAKPNSKGQCNCWQFSHATGVGFWPLKGCAGAQPLPQMWKDPACVGTVVNNWKATASIAVSKGYKYLTTPLVAVDVAYAKKFIDAACGCTAPGQCSCTDASCGCPVYVAFHFYAYDCQPEKAGGYRDFKAKLDNVTAIMEAYPFVKGAIINEVGMLNCAPTSENPICVTDSGNYPATKVPDHSCPANDELPQGLATFIDRLFDIVITAKTRDGRSVVKGFSWFNENMAGGTYNLQLFNPDGSVNSVGESYMRNCVRWGAAQKAAR